MVAVIGRLLKKIYNFNFTTLSIMERETRIDSGWTPAATAWSRPRSLTKVDNLLNFYDTLKFGAGNEIRTRDPNLGKVVLYH